MVPRVAFIQTSLIDYPGRLAAVLFVPGCNFRCPYCQNAPLVSEDRGMPGELVDYAAFTAFLDKRASLLGGVVISGGEPLLQPGLAGIIADIKARPLAVKLDTNGSLPDTLSLLLREASPSRPDYIALDLKTSPDRYPLLAPGLDDAGSRMLASLSMIRESGLPYELRITSVPGIVSQKEMERLAEILKPEDEVILQEFRPGACLDPRFDSVEAYDRGEMAALLAIARRAAPKARVRGWN